MPETPLVSNSHCGTKSQPWKLEAPSGQQIRVSLLDFSLKSTQSVNECATYGHILDKAAGKNESICALLRDRERFLYISAANTVDVVITQLLKGNENNQLNFLIQFKCMILFSYKTVTVRLVFTKYHNKYGNKYISINKRYKIWTIVILT